MTEKLRLKFGDEYGRNVILNYTFRVAGIFFGLVCTRVTIGYLGATLYGLWITITSVVSWMNSGDLGIGNGLRNELAKAYGEGNTLRQKELIGTAINCLAKLVVALFGIIIVICEVLFKTGVLESVVRIPMYATAIFFCINLVLGVSQSIAFSYQKSWLNALTTCEIQLFSIVVVLSLQVMQIDADLLFFSILNGFCTTLPNIILILILRQKKINLYTALKGSNHIQRDVRNSIMNTGMQFFVIQLCAVVLYSTDSLIINKLISTEMVTKYSIITKVYDTGSSLFSILLVALWSAVTYHVTQGNYCWVRMKVKQLLKFWCVFATGVLIVSLLFNSLVKLWIGIEAPYYEADLIILFGMYCVMTAFSAIYVNVLNGIGVVKLQMLLAVIESVLNIILSIFFATTCNMGIFGIKLATFLCASITAIAMPIQAIRILRRGKGNEDCSCG